MRFKDLRMQASEGEKPVAIRLDANDTTKVFFKQNHYCAVFRESNDILHFFRLVRNNTITRWDILHLPTFLHDDTFFCLDKEISKLHMIKPQRYDFDLTSLPLMLKGNQYLAMHPTIEKIYRINPLTQPPELREAYMFEHQGEYYMINEKGDTYWIKQTHQYMQGIRTSVEFIKVEQES